MSKENNLTDFLTDIANTIRAKDGTSATINPQNFSTRIVNYQNKTVTPSTSQQSITKDSGYMALGTVTVNAIPGGTATVQDRTSGGTAVGYGKEVSLTAGYYDAQKFYNSVSAGSATTPTASGASTSTSLSGTTLTVSRSVTPTVVAGYISSGTAGTVTITGTVPTETKAASGSGTISPSAGKLLSSVTVRAVSGSSGSNTLSNTNCTLSDTNGASGISISALSGGYTVSTAGWIGTGTYGNASSGTKYITSVTIGGECNLTSYVNAEGSLYVADNSGTVDIDNSGQVNIDTYNDSSVKIGAYHDYGYDLVRYVYDSSDTDTLTVQIPYNDNGEVGYKTVIDAVPSSPEDGAYMSIISGDLYSTSGDSTTNCFYGTGYRRRSGWTDSGSYTARTSSATLSGTASSLALNSGTIANVYGTGTIAYLGTSSGTGTLNITNNGSSSGYYGYINITNNTTSYGKVRIGGTTDTECNIYFTGLTGSIPSGKTLTALGSIGTITTYSGTGTITNYTSSGTITNMTGFRTITHLGTSSATATLTVSNLGASSSYISQLNVNEDRYGRVTITSGNLYNSSYPLYLYKRELISKSAATTTTFRYLMVNTPKACNWTFSRKQYPYTTSSTRSNGTISTTGSPQYIADTSSTTQQYISLCLMFNGYITSSQTLSLVFSGSPSYSSSSAYTQNITIPANSNGVLFRIIRRNTTYYDIYPTFFY